MSLKNFFDRLKELMEIEGISKRALAAKAGVERKSLLNWVNGINYPRYDALIKLADFFYKEKCELQNCVKGKSLTFKCDCGIITTKLLFKGNGYSKAI